MNANQMLGVLRQKHGEIQYDIERTQARLDRLLAERAECERDISEIERGRLNDETTING